MAVFVSAARNPHVADVITKTSTPSGRDKLDGGGGGGHPTVRLTLPLRDYVTNYNHYLYAVRGHPRNGRVPPELDRELERYREPKTCYHPCGCITPRNYYAQRQIPLEVAWKQRSGHGPVWYGTGRPPTDKIDNDIEEFCISLLLQQKH